MKISVEAKVEGNKIIIDLSPSLKMREKPPDLSVRRDSANIN